MYFDNIPAKLHALIWKKESMPRWCNFICEKRFIFVNNRKILTKKVKRIIRIDVLQVLCCIYNIEIGWINASWLLSCNKNQTQSVHVFKIIPLKVAGLKCLRLPGSVYFSRISLLSDSARLRENNEW